MRVVGDGGVVRGSLGHDAHGVGDFLPIDLRQEFVSCSPVCDVEDGGMTDPMPPTLMTVMRNLTSSSEGAAVFASLVAMMQAGGVVGMGC